MSVTWTLDDGIERNLESPQTFHIPKKWKKTILSKNDLVKLIFVFTIEDRKPTTTEVERMWVIITSKNGDEFEGVLDNDPYCTDQIKSGIHVNFNKKHIIDLDYDSSFKKWLAYL